MDNQLANHPDIGDKLLFSEDMVSYVMTHLLNTPYEATQATPYRGFIHNAFNENMKMAVNHLCPRIEGGNKAYLDSIRELRVSDRNRFLYAAVKGLNEYFSDGFDPKFFLYYCIELSILASLFKENGLQEAPDMAVSCIFDCLQEYDMVSGGWDALNVTATRYASLLTHSTDLLTPDSPQTPDEFGNILPLNTDSDKKDDSSNMIAKVMECHEISEDETKLHWAKSEDASVVNEKISSENRQLHCTPKKDENVHSEATQTIMRDDGSSSVVEKVISETLVADSNSTTQTEKATVAENLEVPYTSGQEVHSVDRFQIVMNNNESVANAEKGESKMHAVDRKSLITDEDRENQNPHSTMKSGNMEDHDGFQNPQMRDVTEDNCNPRVTEDPLPGPSTTIGSADNETNNLINTSTKTLEVNCHTPIPSEKRSPVHNSERHSGKKQRLSSSPIKLMR